MTTSDIDFDIVNNGLNSQELQELLNNHQPGLDRSATCSVTQYSSFALLTILKFTFRKWANADSLMSAFEIK